MLIAVTYTHMDGHTNMHYHHTIVSLCRKKILILTQDMCKQINKCKTREKKTRALPNTMCAACAKRHSIEVQSTIEVPNTPCCVRLDADASYHNSDDADNYVVLCVDSERTALRF